MTPPKGQKLFFLLFRIGSEVRFYFCTQAQKREKRRRGGLSGPVGLPYHAFKPHGALFCPPALGVEMKMEESEKKCTPFLWSWSSLPSSLSLLAGVRCPNKHERRTITSNLNVEQPLQRSFWGFYRCNIIKSEHVRPYFLETGLWHPLIPLGLIRTLETETDGR